MELLRGLPDDLALQCLIRVPYKFHRNVRAVSKRWNALLSSPNFYAERRRHGVYEEGIASIRPCLVFLSPWEVEVVVYYPLGKWWEKLPPLPQEFDLTRPLEGQCPCVYIKSKHHLLVTGLCSRSNKRAVMLMFDFSSRIWGVNILDLHIDTALFSPHALAVSPQDLVYFIYAAPSRRILRAFAYNLEENKLYTLPPIELDQRHRNDRLGAFHNDKYYVFLRGQSVRIYDPQRGIWERVNNREMVDKCVSAFGSLYCFEYKDTYHLTVKEFVAASDSFSIIERYENRRVYCTVPWRDSIFINCFNLRRGDSQLEYYLFHVQEMEEEKRWTSIQMPANFPHSFFGNEFGASVQI